MFVSEVSPTLCLHSESVEVLLKGQAHCLKTDYDLNDTGICGQKIMT